MNVIRSLEAIAMLPSNAISIHIQRELDGLLTEFPQPYDPSVHGWFVVCESVNDLYAPLACLPFSILDILRAGTYDWLGQYPQHYEVLVMLNDNEGVMVYLPMTLIETMPLLHRELSALAASNSAVTSAVISPVA